MKIVMTLTIAVIMIMTIFMIIKDDEMIMTRMITYLRMSVAAF